MPANQVVLITGGNKGLGYETARRLSDQGFVVYIGSRDADRGRAAAAELGVSSVQLDVTDDASVAAAAGVLSDQQGRLDVLINNAGVSGPRRDVPDLTGDDAALVIGTNVVGTVRVTHAFLPLLRRSPAPAIVNVVSGTGSFTLVHDPERLESRVRVPLYSASKSALTMLTVQYARALPGIRVNAADPGRTATDLNAGSGAQTVTEGTDAIVTLASQGPDGPTGTFVDRHGLVGW